MTNNATDDVRYVSYKNLYVIYMAYNVNIGLSVLLLLLYDKVCISSCINLNYVFVS